MLVVETIAKIRRDHFVSGKSIKAIARERGISRNTVRKVLRSDEVEFRYDRGVVRRPQLGPYIGELEQLLADNTKKPRCERLTLIRMYELLRERGYAGGYDAVRRYARRWRRTQGSDGAQAYIPLTFAPGEAYQFDWSHEVVMLDGVTTTVKVAHMRLCHSSRYKQQRIHGHHPDSSTFPPRSQGLARSPADSWFRCHHNSCRGIHQSHNSANIRSLCRLGVAAVRSSNRSSSTPSRRHRARPAATVTPLPQPRDATSARETHGGKNLQQPDD